MGARSGGGLLRGWRGRLLVAAAVLAIVSASAAGLFAAYRVQQTRRMLSDARALEGVAEWQKAKNLFGFYLIKNPDDATVMREYAAASLRIVENRRAAVRDAAGAYYQLALSQPERAESVRDLLLLLEQNGYWTDLEYYATALLRLNEKDEQALYHHALALERLGRLEEAVGAYQRLVEAGTGLAAAYGNMALVLERQGDSGAADAAIERAAGAGLGEGLLELERARLETVRGHLDAAAELLERAEAPLGTTAAVCRAGAELCMARSDWAGAADYLERCVALEPARPEHYLLLALTLQRQTNADAAFDLIEGMDELVRASSPELMTTRCEMFIDRGRWDEAHAAAEAFAEAYPDHVLIHQYLEARMLLTEGDAPGAIERLTAVSRGNPQLGAARYYLALAHLGEGDYERARAVLESFLRDFPDDANGLALRNKLYSAQSLPSAAGGSREEGLARLRARYEAEPSAETARQLAAGLTAAGEREEAGRVLAEAADGPLKDSAVVWAMLADFCLDEGGAHLLGKASTAVTRALLLDPKHAGAMRAAIRLSVREGDVDGALDMCGRYLEVKPDDAGVLAQEASLLLRRGDAAASLEAIGRGLAIADTPAARFVRATALLKLGRHQDALADLQHVAGSAGVDTADHNAAMAQAYLGLGEHELARGYLQSAKDAFSAAGRAIPAELSRVEEALDGGAG